MRSLLEYLPDKLQGVREFKAITATQLPELLALEQKTMRALYNQFVDTADEDGLRLLEKVWGAAGETPEERSFFLHSRMRDRRPSTLIFLHGQLANLCGDKGYTLNLNLKEQTLRVRLALASKSALYAAVSMLEKYKPAVIALDIDLLYNRYSQLEGFTHANLFGRAHMDLRESPLT